MSIIVRIMNSIDINCPHCDTPNEIEDIDASTIIDNTCISRRVDECAFVHKCTDCGGSFKVNPCLDVRVEKVA